LFQDLADISGTVDNAKDKNIMFGNLVNNPEFILDDLPVFKVRDSRKLSGNMTALRMT
jgi:hypothetical protein